VSISRTVEINHHTECLHFFDEYDGPINATFGPQCGDEIGNALTFNLKLIPQSKIAVKSHYHFIIGLFLKRFAVEWRQFALRYVDLKGCRFCNVMGDKTLVIVVSMCIIT